MSKKGKCTDPLCLGECGLGEIEPVASPQATRMDAEKRLLDAVYAEQKRMECAAQPAAGTTPQCLHGSNPYDCQFCEMGASVEETTPQAERPMNIEEAKRRFPEDFSHICQASCSNPCTVIDDARAVAPVEMPERMDAWIKQKSLEEDGAHIGAGKISELTPAQTRLTAEQFYEQDWQHWDSKRTEDDSFWTTAFALAEAFRDKSEAELRAKLAEQEGIVKAYMDASGDLKPEELDKVLDSRFDKMGLNQLTDAVESVEGLRVRAEAAEAEAAALRKVLHDNKVLY